jgi:hypothetical protein
LPASDAPANWCARSTAARSREQRNHRRTA